MTRKHHKIERKDKKIKAYLYEYRFSFKKDVLAINLKYLQH